MPWGLLNFKEITYTLPPTHTRELSRHFARARTTHMGVMRGLGLQGVVREVGKREFVSHPAYAGRAYV